MMEVLDFHDGGIKVHVVDLSDCHGGGTKIMQWMYEYSTTQNRQPRNLGTPSPPAPLLYLSIKQDSKIPNNFETSKHQHPVVHVHPPIKFALGLLLYLALNNFKNG